MKFKKHLSFTALRKLVSSKLRTWTDFRRNNSTQYSVHDTVMSGLACMYFQEPSLLQFQQHLENKHHQNNLRTLFGIQNIPKEKAVREIIDAQDSQQFNPIFKNIAQNLNRAKQLEQFKLSDNLTLCSIDATQYHTSETIRCKHCLTKHKDNPNKPTRYQHFALQAAFMHPDVKQVIPVMAEPIKNTDGTKKQDCELNAAKRMIPLLRQQFPRKQLIITGDDLFSRQSMIELVHEHRFHFFFVAKSGSHRYMTEWINAYAQLPEHRETDSKGCTILYQWMNNVPLNGGDDAVQVNYFCKKTFSTGANGKESLIRTESWVTDLTVTVDNVVLFARGAKTRWKIENECFNTLKNQGYHLTHNYGHGEKNLAFNFYLLTLLAFLFHQVSELTDAEFKACRAKAGSKVSFWEKIRTLINFLIFETWEQLLSFFIHKHDNFQIVDAFVIPRNHPP